ncbi:DUF817 domain-containing protein [Streptoalloteichus hindustanus]|uniref:Uncharacterized membrane protein YoaT, DUF817 family n=1 Tax=Streptoalloteichus hindustanus TaxID=2017 RepID=A0A1M5ENC0_STRHI|nr:DUF817 domain-containing protein [Streptoalloteichus hindustanus]SHF80676.1 Uncharacterized membrane protein YoaT, DUF817 family [Streptoalloteichus hindustanus]
MSSLRFAALQLLRFAWVQARCCAFAVTLFAGLAVSTVVDLPIARYDALLAYGLLATLTFRLLGLETTREVLLVAVFHLIGLVFELVKVRLGSWVYPEDALTKIGGVPLYSGFLYAAVGSYVCRAWRLHELRVFGYRPLATALVAAAIYVNFVTHHWLPDLRWPLAVALAAVIWRSHVHFTVGRHRYRMPLTMSFVLIGFFLWVAENVATFFGAWRYPHQMEVWRLVHPSKFGAWALLVSVAFVVVASWQARRGRLRPEPGEVPALVWWPGGGSGADRVAAPRSGQQVGGVTR